MASHKEDAERLVRKRLAKLPGKIAEGLIQRVIARMARTMAEEEAAGAAILTNYALVLEVRP